MAVTCWNTTKPSYFLMLVKIQIHKRLKRTLFVLIQHANFPVNPFYQATKQYLSNSEKVKNEM